MTDHARVLEWGSPSGGAEVSTVVVPPDSPLLLVGVSRWWERGLLDELDAAGWAVLTADDAARARWLASIRRVSMVVIGSELHGRDMVRDLRTATGVPLVVLADDESDTAALIAAGVDAVLAASNSPQVTFAHLQSVLRRADHRRGAGTRCLHADGLVVDLWTQSCTRDGVAVALSPTEYALLTFLMTRPGATIPTATIVRRVWEWIPSDGRNALRIIVNRLRRKLEDDPRDPAYIASVRGVGYRFVADVIEVADTAVQDPNHVDITPLLHSVSTLATSLHGTYSVETAAAHLLRVVDAAGLADGIGLFRTDGSKMRLVSSLNMPAAWLERVADGVPLDSSFAGAHSMLSGRVVQFADVREVTAHFGGTARHLAGDGFRACHFVPISRDGTAWGHLGLVRRSSQPLDPVAMAYLEAQCSVFLLHVHASCGS